MSLALPPWLAHALRAQRGPIPWSAVVRGALSAGPLLSAGVFADRTSLGVVAAVAAMLAGVNDRPGSRRASVPRIGVPAFAGAIGMALGTYAGESMGAVALTVLLTVVGLVAGGVSAVGPVASGSGTQLLVGAAIGAGMPLPEEGWLRALAYLAGACWLLALRLVLPTPGALAGDFRFDGEREAVAEVYDAVAALLDAVGTEHATDRRVALTAALDHAQDALTGPRLRRYASSSAERRLHAQYAAALPLAEAATALAWAGEAVPGRASAGPRRLAVAVRENTHTGPLPAPTRSAPALRALDDALLRAAEAFDRGRGGDLHTRRLTVRGVLRSVFGAGGREYGLRVALCFGASAAVAQALHHSHWYGEHAHWYWLPATTVFLVKPDLGPLVSRVLCRAAGTVLGALVFAGFALVLPRPEGLVALVAVSGALIPVATRHFAAQTAVVTVLVLALVMVGGEPQASASRITETLLACAIVLIVGHLPMPGQRGGGVRARLAAAGGAAEAYLAHVLREAETPGVAAREAERPALREAGRPDAAKSGAEGPVLREAGRPDAAKPGAEGPVLREAGRPDAAKSGAEGPVLREAGRPDAAKSEVEGPVLREAGRPDAAKPGAEGPVLQEAGRPDAAKSEAVGPVVRETERSGLRDTARPAARQSVPRGPVADTRALRWTLRREAYRALAQARTAIALAAAELPPLARHSEGADEIVAVLERIVDTTTACAVHLDDSGRLAPEQVRRLTELLDELRRLDEGHGRVGVRLPEVPLAG